jgi:hypothetical protein
VVGVSVEVFLPGEPGAGRLLLAIRNGRRVIADDVGATVVVDVTATTNETIIINGVCCLCHNNRISIPAYAIEQQ